MPKQNNRKNRAVSQSQELFWGRPLLYEMPRGMYEELTHECKGDKMQFAMDYINQTYGLLGHVTELAITDEETVVSPGLFLME